MPQDHTGQGFNLYIQHRVALGLGEIAHLVLGEFDVVHFARGKLGDDGLNLVVGQSVGVAIIVVELQRQFVHCRVAAGFDVFQGRGHNGSGFCVVFCTLGFGLATLEIFDCHVRCPFEQMRGRVRRVRRDQRLPSLPR